jgi:hypothetical protein
LLKLDFLLESSVGRSAFARHMTNPRQAGKWHHVCCDISQWNRARSRLRGSISARALQCDNPGRGPWFFSGIPHATPLWHKPLQTDHAAIAAFAGFFGIGDGSMSKFVLTGGGLHRAAVFLVCGLMAGLAPAQGSGFQPNVQLVSPETDVIDAEYSQSRSEIAWVDFGGHLWIG